jgi:hypothetical protein
VGPCLEDDSVGRGEGVAVAMALCVSANAVLLGVDPKLLQAASNPETRSKSGIVLPKVSTFHIYL